MKCINCSADISDNSLFCSFCGTKQNLIDIEAQIEIIENKLSITNCSFSEKGLLDCRQWIKEFGFEEVCEAVDISLQQYLKFDDEKKPVKKSVDIVFSKISGICANIKITKEKPYMADAQKMVNYANKKFYLSQHQETEYKEYISRILYNYKKYEDYTDLFENLFWKLKKSDDKWNFLNELQSIAEEFE